MRRVEWLARSGLKLTMLALGMISFAFMGGALVVLITTGDFLTAGDLAIVGVLLGLPPKYDPAIRFKEWLER